MLIYKPGHTHNLTTTTIEENKKHKFRKSKDGHMSNNIRTHVRQYTDTCLTIYGHISDNTRTYGGLNLFILAPSRLLSLYSKYLLLQIFSWHIK